MDMGSRSAMSSRSLELARIHAEGLFVHDAANRLLRVNEPDPDHPAPRFFLTRTATGNLWRTRYDVPATLAKDLEGYAADEPVIADIAKLREPPRHAAEYRDILGRVAPGTKLSIDEGPAYYLPDLPSPTGSGTVTVTPESVRVLEPNYPYTRSLLPERSPVVARIVDGEAVSVCFSARITAEAAEAGVETVERHRGHGYATEVVQGWAAAVRATGRWPLYSTSWANKASQALAARLQAVQYGVDFSIA
jgi:RimJ/RimL family protein N-acetyltransferase